uniref:Uncharacterized protein n=1 Tax=Hippocampus comes TaxID=109280 RepID=A0A3Q2Y4J7_HIPCM
VAENHSLGYGDGTIDVAQGFKLFLLAVTQHIVLFDSIQQQQHLAVFGFIYFFKHSLSPLDADTLVFVTLRCDHDISLIQHEHPNLLGVDELQLAAPVQHGAGRANDDLFLKLHTSLFIISHCCV